MSLISSTNQCYTQKICSLTFKHLKIIPTFLSQLIWLIQSNSQNLYYEK